MKCFQRSTLLTASCALFGEQIGGMLYSLDYICARNPVVKTGKEIKAVARGRKQIPEAKIKDHPSQMENVVQFRTRHSHTDRLQPLYLSAARK
jgi:hypothetical protein